MSTSRIVVIGGGVAGAAAVAELRSEGFDGDLTLVSAEDAVPYERPPLSKEFLVGDPGDGAVKDPAWYQRQSVGLRLGLRATGLDLAGRTVALSDGSVLGYDQVLLATGVRPRVLPGVEGDGVCYLRTIADATELRDRIHAAGHVAVLGGGDVAAQRLPGRQSGVRVEHHDTAKRHGRAAAHAMLGRREPFRDVHWFWSDQYDHTIQSAGLPDDSAELVIRGSLEQRSFSAFSLDGDRLRAVISLNRPADVLTARRLIARGRSVTAGQLRDESLPLKRLAVPAAAR